MAQTTVTATFNAPAAEVWGTISKFGGIQRYVAAVATIELEGSEHEVGAVRLLTMKDGATVKERLDSLDTANMALGYSILETSLPVANYTGTMKVTPTGEGECEMEWNSQYDAVGAPEEAVNQAMAGFYNLGMKGLRKLHEPA